MKLKEDNRYLAALGIGILGLGIAIGYPLGYQRPHHYVKVWGSAFLDANVGKMCWAGTDYYPPLYDSNGNIEPNTQGQLDDGLPTCASLR